MSRHQAVRNLDLEEVLDESYGYEDEDHDMSAEDRTLLAEGTIQVKSALGVAVSKVTTAQIEEALWHYYFDVDKSVAYLVSKFIAPAPKATKPPQKANGEWTTSTLQLSFSQAGTTDGLAVGSAHHRDFLGQLGYGILASFMEPNVPSSDACDLPAFCQPVKSEPRQSFAHFFQDMPWGSILTSRRQTTFLEPSRPRGGLLGGGPANPPKTSKLAQIAAERKRKLEEKKAQEEAEPRRNVLAEKPRDTNSDFMSSSWSSRLEVRLKAPKARVGETSPAPASPRNSAPGRQLPPTLSQLLHPTSLPPDVDAPEYMDSESDLGLRKANPSSFASALFGSTSPTPSRQIPAAFSLPYMAFSPSFEAFSRPSPDDVVLAAQAEGSLTGKKQALTTC